MPRVAGPLASAISAKDAGLRKFMLGVYNKLMLGILLAGVLAYAAGSIEPVTQLVFGTPLVYVVQWGPVVLLLGSMFFMKNPSPLATGILYWSIVTLLGLGLGTWVLMAESGTGVRHPRRHRPQHHLCDDRQSLPAHGLGLWRSLAVGLYDQAQPQRHRLRSPSWRLWGVVALSLLNFILPPSSMFEWIIMGAVFALSAILIAVETQQLKNGYYAFGGDARSLAVHDQLGRAELLHLVREHVPHHADVPVFARISGDSETRRRSPGRKAGAFRFGMPEA